MPFGTLLISRDSGKGKGTMLNVINLSTHKPMAVGVVTR